MGTEENENKAVSLTDEPSEVTQEEPIEQVMTQETTIDTGTAESSEPIVESEDRDRFEETAKFEEEIERKPKRNTAKKVSKPNSELISNLHDKLRRYSDASKKTDMTIRDIQQKIKDVDKRTSTKLHQIVRDLQTQVKQLRAKIDKIERSLRSKSATSIKKTSNKRNKKSTKKKTRRR
jgi:hypothetical protein